MAGTAAVGRAEARGREGSARQRRDPPEGGAFEALGTDADGHFDEVGDFTERVDVPVGPLAAAGVASEARREAAKGTADVDVPAARELEPA